MTNTGSVPISGRQLVADYQSVCMTLTMVETARYEADRSENTLLQQLNLAGSSGFLQPGDITGAGADFAHDSLDAHVKKAQALQLESLKTNHVARLLQEDKLDYIGKKVTVTVLDTASKSIESVWLDPQVGYKNSPITSKQVTGVIDEVLLDKNALVLKTTRRTRFLNPNRHGYIIYVIDLDTFQPTVEITLN